MMVCLDVDYRGRASATAAVTFSAWSDAVASDERTWLEHEAPAEYEPGQFYKRELPHLLRALTMLPRPQVVIVDGYVWLDERAPGLGAHLHRALGEDVAVIGVAKRPYRRATDARAVLRGQSLVPLWVSAVGCDVDHAARAVQGMHGAHRIPTLLRRVDRLARDAQEPRATTSSSG